MAVKEKTNDDNDHEKSREELLEESIINLRDKIVIANLSFLLSQGKLEIPLNLKALKEEIIVVQSSSNVYPEKLDLGEDYRLVIYGDGEWGSESGRFFPEYNIDTVLQTYATVSDPIFQNSNNDFWGNYDVKLGQLTFAEQEQAVINFYQQQKQYIVDNRLLLLQGLHQSLDLTLKNLQST